MPCNVYRMRPMTLREAKESMGDSCEYVPDPKLGERNNALRKAEWDRRHDEPCGDDGDALHFMCGDVEVPICRAETDCGYLGDLLCDWPMGRGETCDLPLCETHAREIGPDRHLCPIHFAMFGERVRSGRVNPWPPKR